MSAQHQFTVASQWGERPLPTESSLFALWLLTKLEMLQLTSSATLWGTLNAKEVIWQVVSADSVAVIAKCFPPGLPWGGHAGEPPQLIRSRYLSAGNTARQKPFCILQSPCNPQHLNKPHGERDGFFTPVSPNLITIKNSMQAQEGNIPVTFCFKWLKFPVRWASGYGMENLSSLTSPSVLGRRMASGCFFILAKAAAVALCLLVPGAMKSEPRVSPSQ